jgi:hypothetical protein
MRKEGMDGMRAGLIFCICISCVSAFLSATCTAADLPMPDSSDYSTKDNPVQIGALKTHVAYVGETQQARMDGVIRYIDTISNGTGSVGLRMIEQNYMATVSSVPLMFTESEIEVSRITLKDLSRKFSDETIAKMNTFKGSPEGLRSSINKSLSAFDDALAAVPGPFWLAQNSARIIVFNSSSLERQLLLARLGAAGVDTTQAQQISADIDAKFPDLQAAIAGGKKGAIQEVNRAIWGLSQQFRSVVEDYQKNLKIQAAAFSISAIPG